MMIFHDTAREYFIGISWDMEINNTHTFSWHNGEIQPTIIGGFKQQGRFYADVSNKNHQRYTDFILI